MFGLFRPAPLGVDLGTGSVKVIGLNGKKISLAAFMDIPSSDWEDESLLIGRLKKFFNLPIRRDSSSQSEEGISINAAREIFLPLSPITLTEPVPRSTPKGAGLNNPNINDP